MFNLRRILAATDFSAHSVRAESRAALICREAQLEKLELLTVQRTGLGEMLAHALKSAKADQDAALVERALQKFKATESRIKSSYGVRCSYAVRIGDVVAEVLSTSESKSADIVAIGNPAGSCVEKLLGSTAEKLIRLSSRPVLLVRNEPAESYREVLVPVDFSPEAQQAARLALTLAPSAHITFLHAFRVWAEGQMREAGVHENIINGYRVRHGEQARQELNRFVEELGPIRQLVSRVVQFGWTVPVISSYAKKAETDLIVIGKHSGSMVEDFLLGSVAQRTIDQTSCDVLVTPRRDPGNDHWYERTAA